MSQIVLDILIVAGSLLLAASVVLALYRIVRGPSILDRMIGTDVVLASIMCGLGGYMALSDRTDLLPVLIVLAMLGFVGSVSVSRYVSKSDSMTPGAEAGALSDFSSTDWHMPRDARDETPSDAGEQGPGERDSAAEGESAQGEDTTAEAGARSASSQDAGPVTDEVTEIEDPTYDPDADVDGEGEGTGPDPGPDDAEHMSRGSTDADRASTDADRASTDADRAPTETDETSGEGQNNGS
ncbi:monovalent cation/H+ antiporter complex subunit F [Brevibacterium oceani]|uniref:monovalent cation/H+ antiporter complex subunit F n=1 Tax=Brevibacterium oceani TaxID=358099 RepID=UPI0015E6B6ED|nr:monovalent cation/H+ antiporter complex subunit F [Brevibacterium oceani]